MHDEMRIDTSIDNFSYQNKIEIFISGTILAVDGLRQQSEKEKIFGQDRMRDWVVLFVRSS